MVTALKDAIDRLGRVHPGAWFALTLAIRVLALAGVYLAYQQGLTTHRAEDDLPPPGSPVAFYQNRIGYYPIDMDEHIYDDIARNVAAGEGVVCDAGFMVSTPGEPILYVGGGYPYFLGGLYWAFGAGDQLPAFVIQTLLHALAVLPLFGAVARPYGRGPAALAALFYAFHPVLVPSPARIQTESLLVPLICAWLWAVSRMEVRRSVTWGDAIGLGVICGLMYHVRDTTVVMTGLTGLLLAWRALARPAVPMPTRAGLARAAAFGLVFAAIMAPWVVRNYQIWGRFLPLGCRGSMNSWVHNHPGLTVAFDNRVYEGPNPVDVFSPAIRDLPDEPARADRCMELFLEFAREQPEKVLGLMGVRFLMAALPVPVQVDSQSWVIWAVKWSAAIYTKGVLLLLLAIALARRPRALASSPLAFWLITILAWTALQSLGGPGMRFRLAVDPAVAAAVGVLAALAVGAVAPPAPAEPGATTGPALG